MIAEAVAIAVRLITSWDGSDGRIFVGSLRAKKDFRTANHAKLRAISA